MRPGWPARCRLLLSLLSVATALLTVAATDAALAVPPGGGSHQRVSQLRQQSAAQHTAVDVARQRVLAASAAANAALNAVDDAQRRWRKVAVEAVTAAGRLRRAQQRTTKAQAGLDRYAAQAYMSAGAGGSLAGMLSALDSGGPQQAVERLRLLAEAGNAKARTLRGLSDAQREQRLTVGRAAALAQVAAATLREADRARRRATDVVAAEQRQLRRWQQVFALTRRGLSAAEAAAAADRLRQQQLLGAASCRGGDMSGYPNGRLPIAALCPLWGAPGNELLAAAADAFSRLSRAYAAAFGTPICVTDSYRTYDQQAALARSRPGYAARPGTSWHGWARAVDLCGGIQTDGTAANQWMRLNAPGLGWFHPAWAERRGAGPYEPWHWQYAG